jgi:hypothetical protein
MAITPDQRIERLEYAVREQAVEVDRLRIENQALLNWITGDKDALTCLQAIYNSSTASEPNKVRAAAAAIGYERPRMSISVQIGPALLGERLDRGRPMKTVEPLTIEHGAK